MALWIQNLVVITAVGASAFYVGRQGYRAILGKKSKLGSCCAKGCAAETPAKPGAPAPVQFLPLESLQRRIK
jgi:hypothetical protein